MREQFIKGVQECLDDDRLHFLFCLREDYLGELFELRESLPGVMENMYRLRRLSRENAESAITKPASNFNLQIERDLVDHLLEDLSREGVDPAELQIVMYRLYEEMEPPSKLVGQRLYDQLGGAHKILATYLDKALSQLPMPERPVAQDILRAMVASSELRGRWPWSASSTTWTTPATWSRRSWRTWWTTGCCASWTRRAAAATSWPMNTSPTACAAS